MLRVLSTSSAHSTELCLLWVAADPYLAESRGAAVSLQHDPLVGDGWVSPHDDVVYGHPSLGQERLFERAEIEFLFRARFERALQSGSEERGGVFVSGWVLGS